MKPPIQTPTAVMCTVCASSCGHEGIAAAACPPVARAIATVTAARPISTRGSLELVNPDRQRAHEQERGGTEEPEVVASRRRRQEFVQGDAQGAAFGDHHADSADHAERSGDDREPAPGREFAGHDPQACDRGADREDDAEVQRDLRRRSDSTEGAGVSCVGTSGAGPVPGSTPTPNANAPALGCPSASDTTCHDTV